MGDSFVKSLKLSLAMGGVVVVVVVVVFRLLTLVSFPIVRRVRIPSKNGEHDVVLQPSQAAPNARCQEKPPHPRSRFKESILHIILYL